MPSTARPSPTCRATWRWRRSTLEQAVTLLAEKGKELKPLVKGGKGKAKAKAPAKAKANGAAPPEAPATEPAPARKAAGREAGGQGRSQEGRGQDAGRQGAGGQGSGPGQVRGEASRGQGGGQGQGLRCRGARPGRRAMSWPGPGRCPRRRICGASSAPRPGSVGKTEISRHFGLTTDQRPALRELLKALKQDGSAMPAGRHGPGRPRTACPRWRWSRSSAPTRTATRWPGRSAGRSAQGEMPLIYMRPERAGQPALAPGERVLARLKPAGRGKYDGTHGQAGRRPRPGPHPRHLRAWPDHPDRPPPQGGMGGPAGRGQWRRARRDRPGRTPARPGAGPAPRPDRRTTGTDGGAALRLAALHPCAWHPACLPWRRPGRGRGGQGGSPRGPRGPARHPPRHHRRRGCARLRRCGLGGAVRGRLAAARRHRRCGALRPPRQRPGPRRLAARQQRLFPRPRRADAARGAVQRLVQPAPGRGPRLPLRRDSTSTPPAARPATASAAA